MDKTAILKKLKEFGLSAYESKCYLSLFEKDALTVAEVARISGIPRPSAYETLGKLMAKGLCLAKPGEAKMFSVSHPDLLKDKFHTQIDDTIEADKKDFNKRKAEIIEKYEREKNRKLLQLQDEKTIIDKKRNASKEYLIDIVKDLKPLYEQSRNNNNPLDYISVLKDPRQIHRKFVELFSKAEKEVLIFAKPPFAFTSEKEWSEQKKVQDEATARGVIIKGIMELPPEDQMEAFFEMRSNKKPINKGEKARVIDKLPIKLNIYDNKACFFTLVDPIKERTSLTMLVAEHEALTLSFRMLFESVWEKAKDYYIYKGKRHYLYEASASDYCYPYKRKLVTKLT